MDWNLDINHKEENMALQLNILNTSEKRVALDLCLKMLRAMDLESESWVGSYYGGPSAFEDEIHSFKEDCRRLLREINFGTKETALIEYNKLMEKYKLWDENQIESMTLTT
jgi:hypothetical protein